MRHGCKEKKLNILTLDGLYACVNILYNILINKHVNRLHQNLIDTGFMEPMQTSAICSDKKKFTYRKYIGQHIEYTDSNISVVDQYQLIKLTDLYVSLALDNIIT